MNRGCRNRCSQASNSFDTDVQRAAVRICFEHFLNDPAIDAAGEDRLCQPE